MTNETEQRFSNEYQKLFWKRQHGMLKCIVCGKKLKRLPSNLVQEEVINGIRYLAYHSEFSGYSGLDTINKHLECLKELKE